MSELPYPTAIFLDLDDTILDFSNGADPCWRQVCQKFGPQMGGLTPDFLFDTLKETRNWYWRHPTRHRNGRLDLNQARRDIVTAALQRLNIDSPTLANEIADTYSRERGKFIQPFPGALETLRYWQNKGVRMALITNGGSQRQRRKIDAFKLAPFFDCILVEEEFGVGKPDERVYHHVLNQLQARPEDTWMIGDNLEWEVLAPQKLGITGIWVDYMSRGLPSASSIIPDRIITSLSDLLPGGRNKRFKT